MRLFIFLLPLILFARENPFFLPNERVSPVAAPQEKRITVKHAKESVKPDKNATTPPKVAKASEENVTSKQIAAGTGSHKKLEEMFLPKPKPKPKPPVPQQKPAKPSIVKEVQFSKVLLHFENNALMIVSKDRLKRRFFTQSPHKLVLDFYARRSFPTKRIALGMPHFKEVAIGAHPGYYRMAIELQDCAKNSFKRLEKGYLFYCEEPRQ